MTTQSYAETLRNSIDVRRDYEVAKNADCDSMKKHLSAYAKRLSNDAVVALCEAANLDANILNRAERSNARFNIYAFDKILSDISSATMNHYSRAILKAAIALQAASLTLTHADATAVCSSDNKHRDKSREKIISSARYQRIVAAATVATQSSSSINSLCALNVLTESRNAANHACYSIADNDFATALIASVQQ